MSESPNRYFWILQSHQSLIRRWIKNVKMAPLHLENFLPFLFGYLVNQIGWNLLNHDVRLIYTIQEMYQLLVIWRGHVFEGTLD